MSASLQLVRLAVQNLGVFKERRVELGPFATGVSIVTGPNESGKSTLVEALRTTLFERHGAKHLGIRALQPHGTRLAPEVWVELDLAGQRLSIYKRFLEKPAMELQLGAGGRKLQGDEAEEQLQRLLEAQPAGKQGASRDSMGVWGLLWVQQDGSAADDPGGSLGENVRSSLAEVIGRQVGQVMGGRHGERVYDQIQARHREFFTTTTRKPTGEYLRARDRVEAVRRRVSEIEKAIAATEDLATLIEDRRERQRAAEWQLPKLQREIEEAIKAASKVQALVAQEEGARAEFVRARDACETAEKERERRLALIGSLEDGEHEHLRRVEVAAEIDRQLADARALVEAARHDLQVSQGAVLEARQQAAVAEERLLRARQRTERQRLEATLQAARELAGKIEEARRQAATLPDATACEEITRLAAQRDGLCRRLEREGTRIVLDEPSGSQQVFIIASRQRVEVPGLGMLEVDPAKPGLARALEASREAGTKLGEALLSATVPDLPAARSRRTERLQAEQEHETLTARLAEIAPKGVDVLAQEATRAGNALGGIEARLEQATRLEHDRDEKRQLIAGNRVDEAALRDLRKTFREVERLRLACDAAGTRVTLLARTDLELRAEDRPPERLTAGRESSWVVTRAMKVALGDVAELRFEPRSGDVEMARKKHEQAASDLDAMLEHLGVDDLDEAERRADERAALSQELLAVERSLLEQAPKGLEALRDECDRARKRSQGLEQKLVEARAARDRLAKIAPDLAANHVGAEVLERLEELATERRRHEAEVARCAARILCVDGPLFARLGGEAIVVTTRTLQEMPGLPAWEMFPGEAGAELDLAGAERVLRSALQRAGLQGLEELAPRREERVRLDETARVLEGELSRHAPEGIARLEQRLATLPVAGTEDGPAVDMDALEQDVASCHKALRNAEDALAGNTQQATDAESVHSSRETQLARERGEITGHASRLDDQRAGLEACRKVLDDESLQRRCEEASRLVTEADAKLQEAVKELEAATPGLLDDEVERARNALENGKTTAQKLRDEVVGLDTQLSQASAEGHFEELLDAKVEQTSADEALARMEREAQAVDLLAHVAETEYEEARRKLLEPVLREAAPYLGNLRPGTTLRLKRDLSLEKVMRQGVEEEFSQLSGGTREQLSVIVRLALARVFAHEKLALPLILDDVLGWTDDARFLSMVRILSNAAKELQVIILTCHPERFARFQAGYVADLEGMRASAGEALGEQVGA